MLFTGSLLALKRDFYTQTGNYGFAINASVDNTSGIYHLGLSGDAGVLDFKLESGKMYWGEQFIHAYQAYSEFSIEAQFTSGTVNILRDNNPLIYGGGKPSGHFNYFYFTRSDASMGGEFNVKISGDSVANYSIPSRGYLTASGQNAVTGWFINQGAFPIRIFDSTKQSLGLYDFGKLVGNISSNDSGAFAFTGDYDSLDFSNPILTTFATNYGDVDVNFSIIDTRSLDWFIRFTNPTTFGFNSVNVLNRDLSYINYSGGVATYDYNANLTFVLGYVSGSGTFTSLTNYSIPGYGQFRQSGLVTGYLDNITGGYPVTGSSWATGAATGFFSGMGTGIVSGLGYTGIGTGYMTGLATGFIYTESGTLDITYPLVGSGFRSTGDYAPIGQPYTGSFSITISGSGSYIYPITGQYYLPYNKTFTGAWSLSTGLTPTTLVPISPSSSILYSGSGIFPPNSSINFQVTYTPSGETPDGAYLFITGSGVINGINQQLTMPL